MISEQNPSNWIIRAYRPEDIPALVSMNNAINRAYNIAYTSTVEEYAQRLAGSPWEPTASMIVAEDHALLQGNEIVGSARMMPARDLLEGQRGYDLMLSIHPAVEGQGLEHRLAARLLDMVRRREEDEVEVGQPEPVLHAFAGANAQWRLDLWSGLGFEETRVWYHMKRLLDDPIEEPADVEGLVMRPYRVPEDDDPAFEAAVSAFADHYGFNREYWEAEWRDWNSRPQSRLNLSWVAEVEGKPGTLAGVVICYEWQTPSPDNGLDRPEILVTEVATVREWRRKGVARNLLLHTLRGLRDAGYGTAVLNVDGESTTRAYHVYETVGFFITERYIQFGTTLGRVR